MDRLIDFVQALVTFGAGVIFWSNTPENTILGWVLLGVASMLNVVFESKQRARGVEAGLYLLSIIIQGAGVLLAQGGLTNLAYVPMGFLILVNGYEFMKPILDGAVKVVGK